MESRKLVAVVAVAIVLAASSFIVFAGQGDGSGFSPSGYPAHLAVLGNADHDDAITASDAEVIRKVVETGYDNYSEVYMCDANNDGVVDREDAIMVDRMVAAQASGDWSKVGMIHYIDVDKRIASYDMTGSDKVITIIAPVLDTVLAMGGKDLVVGFDNRITTGKYHEEYASLFDFSKMIDVGSCNEPDTESITRASDMYGGVTVVCGTRDSYGPTMESVFAGTDVQIVRVASWEYGETMYGFITLAYLLKCVEGAERYVSWYDGCMDVVADIVASTPDSDRSVGAAAAYGYLDELSLLGTYTGEHAALMSLRVFDSAGSYLGGGSGGHGNSIADEAVSAMYADHSLRNLVLMVGTPFQTSEQAKASYMEGVYEKWCDRLGADAMPGLNICVSGYSFSSGVSEVLNQLILCYWMYNDEFLAHFGCSTQKEAQDVLAGYVDAYCGWIGISDAWSFYGADGTRGMNLLYCGDGDPRNIMYGGR